MKTLATLLLCTAAGMAAAADLKVLSAGAVEPGLAKLAEQFTRDTHHKVRVQYATAPQLNRRLAGGELADVLIAPPGVMNEQLRRSRVDPESHFVIGRVGVGVVVRLGNSEPDLSNLERFKQSLLGADSIVYNQASTGLYLEKLFELLGIGEQLKPRTTRFATGEEVLEHTINGRSNEIGFGAITAIRLFETRGGLKFVGPLPEQIQHRTAYIAGLMTEAPIEDVARDFLRFLGTPAAKATFAAVGIE
ncbi:MAG: substrate-binding domain-containing protein [Burkholderiales bacterium]